MSHQNSGPRDYVHKDFHKHQVDFLQAQLTDAKRNEETAVARVAELEVDREKYQFNPVLAATVFKQTTTITELKRSRDELVCHITTLEAAVRAVRDGERRGLPMCQLNALDKLYALVPDGSEGGP